jgi:hypothetical protein
MRNSASRRSALQRACNLIHDQAFCPRNYPVSRPSLPDTRPALATSRSEWLDDHVRKAIQREFEKLGLQ